ncbi:hypothetical protein [Archaeoglobus veneficus]|uniref:hypothetical protein n=1 Tax=Archaeoglobus veneficus TaxID=58290 RepID=UPI00064F5A2E|nr:hypothetical protein [Archaeoglobus veneficus]
MIAKDNKKCNYFAKIEKVIFYLFKFSTMFHDKVRIVHVLLAIFVILSSVAIVSADVSIPGRESEYMRGKLLVGLLILLIFFAITVCIELVTTFAYLVVRKVTPKKKILLAVLLANAVSYPLFIIALEISLNIMKDYMSWGLASRLSLFPSEAFVILLESAIINKSTEMSLRESVLLSLLINLVSMAFPAYLFFK